MNATRRIKHTLGLGLVLTLALGLGSALSGQPQPEPTPDAKTLAAKPTVSESATCLKCSTEAYDEFAATKIGNEYVTRTIAIGVKHTCDACGGRILQVGGQTQNQMMDYCTICAKARPTCCVIAHPSTSIAR